MPNGAKINIEASDDTTVTEADRAPPVNVPSVSETPIDNRPAGVPNYGLLFSKGKQGVEIGVEDLFDSSARGTVECQVVLENENDGGPIIAWSGNLERLLLSCETRDSLVVFSLEIQRGGKQPALCSLGRDPVLEGAGRRFHCGDVE